MSLPPLVQIVPLDDPARLAALARTGLMDTAPEPAFDRLTRLACRLLRVPMALLTLVDRDRAFIKSAEGQARRWRARGLPSLAHALAPRVVRAGAPLVVDDAWRTPGLVAHPAVAEFGVRAYVGVPVSAPGGHLVGALAVADSEPRGWRDDDVAGLEEIAALARTELDLNHAHAADPLAGLLTPQQLASALAGRLAAAEVRGEPYSLIHLAVVAAADAPAAGTKLARSPAALGDHGLVAHAGGATFWLLPREPLEASTARRLAGELAELLAVAVETAAVVAVHAGVATSRPGDRPTPRELMAVAARRLRPVGKRGRGLRS